MHMGGARAIEYQEGTTPGAAVIAGCFALLCTAGSLRFVFGSDQLIYYAAVGLLGAMVLLRARTITFERDVLTYLLVVFLLVSWLAFSSLWTLSPNQAAGDLVLVVALGAVAFLATALGRPDWLKAFFLFLTLFGLLIGGFVLLTTGMFPVTVHLDRGVQDAYLSLSATIGAGFVISTVQALHSRGHRWMWLLFSILLMVSLSQSLGRGALLASIAIIAVIGLFHVLSSAGPERSKGKVALKYLALGLPLLIALVYFALSVERTSVRLERMMDVDRELAQGGRGQLWGAALEHIAASPITGYGLGSSGEVISGKEGNYPHNLLLQLWLDGGAPAALLGLAMIIIPLTAGVRILRRNPYDTAALSLLGLFAFYLLEYMKSHTFYTARPLLIGGVLLVVYAASVRVERDSRSRGSAPASGGASATGVPRLPPG